MAWIRLDPLELGAAGATLKDASLALADVAARLRSAWSSPGLGQHASTLMVEGEAESARVLSVTESYLRLAIDVIQRAIAAVRDAELVSEVGGVGSVSSAVIGGSTVGVGTPGWASAINAPTIGTIGGTGPAILTIASTGSSDGSIPGMVTATVGGSTTHTDTDNGFPPSVALAAAGPASRASSARTLPRGGMTPEQLLAQVSLAPFIARNLGTIRTDITIASTIGTPSASQVNDWASTHGSTSTPNMGQPR